MVCRTTKNKPFRNWPWFNHTKAVFPPGCICLQLFPAPRLAHLLIIWSSLHTVYFKHTSRGGVFDKLKLHRSCECFAISKHHLYVLSTFCGLASCLKKWDTVTVQTDCPDFTQYLNISLFIYVTDTLSCVITKDKSSLCPEKSEPYFQKWLLFRNRWDLWNTKGLIQQEWEISNGNLQFAR